jgi:hypothetical protein
MRAWFLLFSVHAHPSRPITTPSLETLSAANPSIPPEGSYAKLNCCSCEMHSDVRTDKGPLDGLSGHTSAEHPSIIAVMLDQAEHASGPYCTSEFSMLMSAAVSWSTNCTYAWLCVELSSLFADANASSMESHVPIWHDGPAIGVQNTV